MAPKFFARLAQALKLTKTIANQAVPEDLPSSGKPFGVGALVHSRYRLEAEIGRGGMGIVYRARDIPKDQEVAFKIVNLEKANVLSLYQFSREATIASRLDHPHIVRVYETGTVDAGADLPSPYIVMELVNGTGLDELHGFTYRRIIEIGRQICEALGYAHDQGFVHRDLKPGNILVEKRGFQTIAKLTDFGLARPRDSENLPSESNLAGTIFYLAPEVIAGQFPDISSDLYAFGAMLYEMITGRVPFSDFIDDQAILTQHLEEPVAPPSHSRGDLPPALEAIVMRLLEKNPKDRFASAQEVLHALEQVKLPQEPNAMSSNLPELAIDFGAYEQKVETVVSLLETSRLVTILGNGGALAQATAARLADQFPDGAWFVEFNLLNDPALVLPTTASVLCVHGHPQHGMAVSLIECLREKHLLLLLNHCDHLLGACAQLTETILRTCPEVYILATSRRPFGLSAENCYREITDLQSD